MIDSPPSKFKYPLKTVTIAIKLVVVGLLSLRGVNRAFAIFEYCFGGGTPSHTVIHNWVMRYGLYILNELPKKRDDWIYILDHSIESGRKQCLLILGVSLKTFRQKSCRLRHEDMKVLATDIVDSATGDSVTKSLMRVAEKTGVPAQIVSDGGPNIINGCEEFIKLVDGENSILKTYDVTHQAALILKHLLTDDERWKSFCEKTRETKRFLVHTVLGHLAPPKPRDKSRWQNLDIYVKWAEMILKQKKSSMSKQEKEKFEAKLEWIKAYKSQIREWRSILNLLESLKFEVKTNGLSRSTRENFEKASVALNIETPRMKKVHEQIMSYIKDECDGLDGVFLGSSDIIESVFGKYKNFSGKSPMKEIGRTILTIPAFTSKITYSKVDAAMDSVSAQDVTDWLSKNIGTTLLTKRKKAFSAIKTKNKVKKS